MTATSAVFDQIPSFVPPFVPRVLQNPSIGRRESILDCKKFKGRGTAVGVPVYNKREILLVRPAKGDGEWNFFQGGTKPGDKTLEDSLRREAYEELRLLDQHCIGFNELLGECLNPIPPERGKDYTHKHLFVFAVPVRSTDWVVLNNEENDRHEWVKSYTQLIMLIGARAESRPVKYQAMLDTISLMHDRRLLKWSYENTKH